MKVNVETQLLCVESKYLRGIPFYIMNLIRMFNESKKNEYSISYFDYQKERGNKLYIEKHLAGMFDNIKVCECNELSYKSILAGIITNRHELYNAKTYSEYMGYKADLYHFPSVANVPRNVDGKVVVTVCDILPILDQYKKYWTKEHQYNFWNSTKYVRENREVDIISISENTKTDLVEVLGIEPERIYTVPLACDSNSLYEDRDYAKIRNIGIDTPYLLYIGAIDYRKGIVEIVRAFDIIKRAFPDMKLVLAGNVEAIFKDRLAESLNASAYSDDVVLTGFVDENTKRKLISCAEILLFPSEYEGFGLPILEGMACRTPVITTKVSSIPEVGGDAVVYCEVNNCESLAEKINFLLQDSGVRDDYVIRGDERLKIFSWEKTSEMTESVYELCGR